jgi:hypothetical protein
MSDPTSQYASRSNSANCESPGAGRGIRTPNPLLPAHPTMARTVANPQVVAALSNAVTTQTAQWPQYASGASLVLSIAAGSCLNLTPALKVQRLHITSLSDKRTELLAIRPLAVSFE